MKGEYSDNRRTMPPRKVERVGPFDVSRAQDLAVQRGIERELKEAAAEKAAEKKTVKKSFAALLKKR